MFFVLFLVLTFYYFFIMGKKRHKSTFTSSYTNPKIARVNLKRKTLLIVFMEEFINLNPILR